MTDFDALNEYLDGDAPEAVDLSGVPREELAKALLIAGATAHLLSESTTAKRDVVSDSMALVFEDERLTRRRRIRNGLFATIAAAAAIVVTTLVYFREPPSLQPLLESIRGFVLDELDREYRVTTESSTPGAAIFAESMSLTLYVRGTDRYAAELEFDLFGRQRFSVWLGSNGDQHWIVPPKLELLALPVIVSNESLNTTWKSGELGMVEEFAQRMVRAESAMTLFALLADLESSYRVEAAPESTAAQPPEGRLEIIAYRHPQADITIPDTIRMVVDEATGVLHHVQLKFADLPSHMGVENPFRSIRYELLRETVEDEALYDHESHHDGNRQVIVR